MQNSRTLFASPEICERHQVLARQKTLVLYDTEQPECNDWERCPCCNQKMVPDGTERFSLRCNPDDLSFLGPGVCLYFSIVKFMLVFMCIPLLGALGSAVVNYDKCGFKGIPDCLDEHDEEDSLHLQLCIHFGAWVVAALYYPLSFIRFMKSSIRILLQRPTAADYTVKVSGIERLEDPNELRRHLQKLMRQNVNIKPEIEAVFPAYNIGPLRSIQKNLSFWEKTLSKFERNTFRLRINRCCRPRMITQNICQIKVNEYQARKNRVFAEIHEEEASVAFVAFKYPYHARLFIDSFSVPFFIQLTHFLQYKLCCKKRKVRYSQQQYFDQMLLTYKRPSHPEDIWFENLSLPFSKRLKKQTITVITAVCLLAGASTVLFLFRFIQKKLSEEDEDLDFGNLLVSLIISIVILGLNLILEQVMAKITIGERHPSHTAYKTGVARKLITLMFINTAVVPTVVSAYTIEDTEQSEWFTNSQLWLDVYVIVTVNAIFPPLLYLYLFNPLWWLNRLNKRVMEKQNYGDFLQSEANEICTPLEVDFSERYAQVIKTLYVGLFFSPVVPMSIPLSMLGIAFDYWVTKYMLLRKHPKPMYHNEKLGLEMKEWMRYGLAVYAVGIAFFYFKLNGNLVTTPETEEWYNLEWISIAIGVIGFAYLCIPMNYLIKLKYFNSLIEEKIQNDEAYSVPYREKRFEFNTDFERANPALRRQARFIYEHDQATIDEWRRHGCDGSPIFEQRQALEMQYRELAAAKNRSSEAISSIGDN